jgi:hypothetical protein
MESTMIMIAGEPMKVFYDTQAQMDTEQNLYLMSQGINKRLFLDILDSIVDTREIVTLVMQGINGANRAEGIDKRLTYDEAAKIFDNHMKYIGQNAKDIKDVRKAFEDMKTDIKNAAYKNMHLDFLISPIANQ